MKAAWRGVLLLLSTLSLWAWNPPASTRQLLVVVSDSWNAPNARLYRFEKSGKNWHKVGSDVSVKVGKRGMGWGRGLYVAPRAGEPRKREGDLRSPAGVFELPFLFGEGADHFRYPYRRMTRYSRCVDDGNSRFYNHIIDSRKVPHDYRSFEKMKFASGLYGLGIFVDHNPKRIPGAGSCIFLHIRKADGEATVGCTAMDRPRLFTVAKWLDPKKHPLLIQAPRSVIGRLLPDNLQLTLFR